MLNEFAPAKLNLYLHITGRRADGYHDLDSLVAFTGIGDEVRIEAADSFSFHIEGPQAAKLKGEDPETNLAVKASRSLAQLAGKSLNVKMTLVKNLPVASGIGGGSSDAAAALRALAKLWGMHLADPRLYEAAAKHGQDVPVCLKTSSNYITAEGNAPAPQPPYADIVMVNPNKGLSTPDVYKAYKTGAFGFSPKAQLTKDPADLHALVSELRARKNDLRDPAIQLMPEIGEIIDVLQSSKNCLYAQMSGSGATCFGIYEDRNAARLAASDILEIRPHWWVAQSYIPCRTDPRQDL